jgi:DNA-binding MarR family transcriptional regulator
MSSPSRTSAPHAETDLFVAFMQIADRFGNQAEQVVRVAGLTGAQYNVLRILRGAGRDGLACREIGDRMISHDPDITRLLDRMEKRGLITRERQSDDRRVVKTCVTLQGLDLLKTLDQPIRALHKRQFHRIGAARLKILSGLLEQIRTEQSSSHQIPNSKRLNARSGARAAFASQ